MFCLTIAIQCIMPVQPSIILIFSNELQPIYPISKQDASVNLDCNGLVEAPVLPKLGCAKPGLSNATDH